MERSSLSPSMPGTTGRQPGQVADRPMPSLRLPFLMPVLAVIAVAAVFGAAAVQRSTATTQADHADDARALLVAMLDQETGLRGYLLNKSEVFLEPFRKGTTDYAGAVEHVRSDLRGDDRAVALIDRGDQLAQRWHELAVEQVAEARRPGSHAPAPGPALARKRLMDAFRAANGRLLDHLDDRRVGQESRALWLSTAIALFVLALVGGLGTYLVTRRQRQERAAEEIDRQYRDGQAEFVETLQAVDDETEANLVLKRYIERWSP